MESVIEEFACPRRSETAVIGAPELMSWLAWPVSERVKPDPLQTGAAREHRHSDGHLVRPVIGPIWPAEDQVVICVGVAIQIPFLVLLVCSRTLNADAGTVNSLGFSLFVDLIRRPAFVSFEGLANTYCAGLEIEIRPLQGEQFTASTSRRGGHHE